VYFPQLPRPALAQFGPVCYSLYPTLTCPRCYPLCLQPTFEVLAVAVNSGLAAYPAAYTRVWSGAGGAIWRPVPPPGYVAAGDLFTTDGHEPELSDMVCLHGECRGLTIRPAAFD